MPYLVLGIGIVAISFAAILIKLCSAPSLIIAAYRLGVASVVILGFAGVGRRPLLKEFPRSDRRLALLSGLLLAAHFATWITSLEYTSVASSVVLVTTNPLFVAIGATLLLHERPSSLLLLAIGVTVFGGVIIGLGDWLANPGTLLGNGLAFLGAIMGSGYLLIGRFLRPRIRALSYVAVVYSVAALALILLALAWGLPFWGYDREVYILLLLIALVPQLIGHTSINWSLRYLSASFVAVAILGEPVGATLLAYLILHEVPTPERLMGAVFILAGVYLGIRAESRNRSKAEARP